MDAFFTSEPAEVSWRSDQIAQIVSESPVACIVTCRSSREGGEYTGDPEAVADLYRRLAEEASPPGWIDIELSSIEREPTQRTWFAEAAQSERPRLVLSFHDFGGRPLDLARRSLALREKADLARAPGIVKIAHRARSIRDSLDLLDLCAAASGPTIALGMGEFGLLSRVLAPKFGGYLTFAALHASMATAPGQPTISELLDQYRFRSISRTTPVYGVLGWPVGHSLSPLLHNAGLASLNRQGVYLPLPVAADPADPEGSFASFKGTLLELIHHPRLCFAGCSVTIPHKEHLARVGAQESARESSHAEVRWSIDELTRKVGAANTLVVERNPDGRVIACRVLNTDGPAAADCLQEVVGDLAGKSVLLVGAGGVAAGIGMELALRGARVWITNRTPARARELCAKLNAGVPGSSRWTAIEDTQGAEEVLNAVINCTPIGMHSGPDPAGLPIVLDALALRNPGLVVMDTVYNPMQTPLLVRARQLRLAVIDGVGMFVRQAAAQFTAWTQSPAPVELFERLVRSELDRRAAPPVGES